MDGSPGTASPAGRPAGEGAGEMRSPSSLFLSFLHDLPMPSLLDEVEGDELDVPDIAYPGEVCTGLEGIDEIGTVVPSLLFGQDGDDGMLSDEEDEDEEEGDARSSHSLADALSAKEESACGSVRGESIELCERFDEDLELPPGFS
eukprot:CAMPEP_0174930102 /NCGR_PEP_ID=MMETSP1355-20121228/30278_1 /TAXON_ID=464990 /ORGANISM="Hemiselmis tepida, Strain CCMP443" /LENGTH=145 /DNA_ID=CAMNT_0016176365 /DNA_START=60 /DNA_END=494 /DNA_ORIENTATION=-